MFETLSNLIKQAELSGITLSLKQSSNDELTVILSFMAAFKDEIQHYNKPTNSQADKHQSAYIDLKAALARPVIITKQPQEIEEAITNAIATLRESVTAATQTLSSIDLSASLDKAVATAKATTSTPKKPDKKKQASNTSEAEQTPSTTTTDFNSIDSL